MNEEISNILNQYLGSFSKVLPLPGYDDLNFLIMSRSKKYILKIHLDPKERTNHLIQNSILSFLSRSKFSQYIPSIINSLKGHSLVESEYEGRKVHCRMLSFLEGKFMHESDYSEKFIANYGAFVGAFDNELSSFDTDLTPRSLGIWDLKNFQSCRQKLKYIADPELYKHCNYVLHMHWIEVLPKFEVLKECWIHGDVNDWNVIKQGDSIGGLIDFGDVCFSHRINNPSICLSYLLLKCHDPVESAAIFIQDYHSKNPLEKEEICIIYWLILARLVTSIVSAYEKQAKTQRDDEYLFVTANQAIPLIQKLLEINPIHFQNELLKACNFEIKTPSTEKIRSKRSQYFSRALSLSYPNPIHLSHGAFQYLFSQDGKRYLDCVNNIAHVGHSHPSLTSIVHKQYSLLNTNTRYLYPQLTKYAEHLLNHFDKKYTKVFLVNSGSAATDLAIRLATTHTKRSSLMVLENGYHGNTQTAIDCSSYKFDGKGGQGKKNNIHLISMPDHLRMDIENEINNLNTIYQTFNQINQPAAFISESILGCGGQMPMPEAFMKSIYEWNKKLGILNIADEVQTGFGRTGKQFWAFESIKLDPDIVILGKPIANGHPVGAVVTTDEIATSFENGMEFFSSFGGNPASCALASEVLKIISRENLMDNANAVGEDILKTWNDFSQEFDFIAEARGSGYFLGLDMVSDKTSLSPDGKKAAKLVHLMKEDGILLSTDGPSNNVVKFKPPMCFNAANADELCSRMLYHFKNSI